MDRIVNTGVLIADPQPSMASLIATMVRGLGLRMVMEVSALDDLAVTLAGRGFGLVIMDDQIGPAPIDLVRQIRADPGHANRTTAIIMLSTAPLAQNIAEARDAGVSEFLRKPFSTADLQKRIVSLELAPRGFIEAPDYAGPDRRRRSIDVGTENQRAQADEKPGDQN